MDDPCRVPRSPVIAYFECFSGAAGDMILAALLDAGASLDRVNEVLQPLGVEVSVESVLRKGLRALHLSVSGGCTATTYAESLKVLEAAALSPRARATSVDILTRLAGAEARIHDVPIEQVHFHELSAADTIADVVGVAVAFDDLDIEHALVSSIATGRGTIDTSHGTMPALAPATAELLRGFAVNGLELDGELVTPTGAAIIASVTTPVAAMPPMWIDASGYGGGTRELQSPNVLRVLVGRKVETPDVAAEAVLLSANIDDMNPEIYEYALERLFDAGVVDAWLTPSIGKKGRPAVVLNAIVQQALVEEAKRVFFKETSTLGVRMTQVERFMLDRQFVDVVVSGKNIRVKIGRRDGEIMNISPEYTDCREVAAASGLALKDVYQLAITSARERI